MKRVLGMRRLRIAKTPFHITFKVNKKYGTKAAISFAALPTKYIIKSDYRYCKMYVANILKPFTSMRICMKCSFSFRLSRIFDLIIIICLSIIYFVT